MRQLSVTILLFLFGYFVNAQEGSVKEKLEKLKKDIRQSTYYDSSAVFKKGQEAIELARKNNLPSEEATIYQFYGNFYYFSYNVEKAKANYSKSIEIARKAGDLELVNSTKIRLAFIESAGDVVKAEKKFKELLVEAEKNNFPVNQIEIYNGLGNLYSDRMIRDTAMNYYLKGLKLAEKDNRKYHQAMMLNNIGLLKFSDKKISEAAKDFERAVKLITNMNEDRLMLNLNNNLGLVFKELKDYNSSIQYYQNTLLNARKLGFPQAVSVAYLNLSDSYLKNKDFATAEIYADSAINRLRELKEMNFLGMGYLIKSNIHLDQQHLIEANMYADSLKYFASYYSSPNNMLEYYKLKSDIKKKEGDFKNAMFFLDKYYHIKDSLEEITNDDKLAELQVIYGKEKADADLENEKNKNSLLSKENELKRTRMNLIIIISVFLILGVSSILYIRYMRIVRNQKEFFTQKLIENTDNERSRISKDLHDDIGQSLSIIKSKINMFNSGKIQDLEGLDKEVGEVIEQTRAISHQLHPSAVAKMGLERSIVSLLEKTQSNTGIVCSISVKKDVEAIDNEVKTQVYRIIQECINNTIKHANATALKVSLSQHSGSITMTYQDNGKGMSDEKNNSGIGMLTIKERAAAIKGKIQTPSTDKGFKLILTIQST
ncbi:MAG: tetratricopeptide repeat protein [Bacteroidetes bacterium]|nr:MAG: tetratricopeptide repeat protein [Bacteroidota bacterium]